MKRPTVVCLRPAPTGSEGVCASSLPAAEDEGRRDVKRDEKRSATSG